MLVGILLSACGGIARSGATSRPGQSSTTILPTVVLKRAPPSLHLTNADRGHSYTVPIGTFIVVVLSPPPKWAPNLVLGGAPVRPGQPPSAVQLLSDKVDPQGDLVAGYVAAAPGQGRVGARSPCTNTPAGQCNAA